MTPKRGRGRKPLPDLERKDRVVQTRVPEELDETLRVEARRNRVSVSQLIRNVLEDTFDLVDNVVQEAAHLGHRVKRDAQRVAESARGKARHEPPADVLAWQEVVINRDARCARCGRALKKGQKALVGLSDDAKAPRQWLCRACGAAL
jgi:hypothetical protein